MHINYRRRVFVRVVGVARLQIVSRGRSRLTIQLQTGLLKVDFVVFVTYSASKFIHVLIAGAEKRWFCSRVAPGNYEKSSTMNKLILEHKVAAYS